MFCSPIYLKLPLELQNYIYEFNPIHRQQINDVHIEYFSYLHEKKLGIVLKNLTNTIYHRYYCVCENDHCREDVLIGSAILYHKYNSESSYYCSEACMYDDISNVNAIYTRYLQDVNYTPDY